MGVGRPVRLVCGGGKPTLTGGHRNFAVAHNSEHDMRQTSSIPPRPPTPRLGLVRTDPAHGRSAAWPWKQNSGVDFPQLSIHGALRGRPRGSLAAARKHWRRAVRGSPCWNGQARPHRASSWTMHLGRRGRRGRLPSEVERHLRRGRCHRHGVRTVPWVRH